MQLPVISLLNLNSTQTTGSCAAKVRGLRRRGWSAWLSQAVWSSTVQIIHACSLFIGRVWIMLSWGFALSVMICMSCFDCCSMLYRSLTPHWFSAHVCLRPLSMLPLYCPFLTDLLWFLTDFLPDYWNIHCISVPLLYRCVYYAWPSVYSSHRTNVYLFSWLVCRKYPHSASYILHKSAISIFHIQKFCYCHL